MKCEWCRNAMVNPYFKVVNHQLLHVCGPCWDYLDGIARRAPKIPARTDRPPKEIQDE